MTDIYDKVLRAVINDCSRFVLPYINEAFGEHYTGKEQIVFQPNELIISHENEDDSKRITDTNFTVIGETEKKYHLECESGEYNSSMLIRLFEYDAQIALNDRVLGRRSMRVKFPHTSVLYLKNRGTIPSELKVTIEVPGGNSVSYTVPVVRMRDYTAKELFDKELYMMIPFYIFNHANRFKKCRNDPEELNKILDEFRYIADELEKHVKAGKLDSFEAETIADLLRKVTEAKAKNCSSVRKGVDEIMRGPTIITEARKTLDKGIAQGISKAQTEIARNMLLNKEPDNRIIAYTGISFEELNNIKEELLKNG